MSETLLIVAVVLLLVVVLLQVVQLFRKVRIDLSPVAQAFQGAEKAHERTERAVRDEIAKNREELTNAARQSREGIASTLKGVGDSLTKQLGTMRDTIEQRLTALHESNSTSLGEIRQESVASAQKTREEVSKIITDFVKWPRGQFAAVVEQLKKLTDPNEKQWKESHSTLEGKITYIQEDNATNAEETPQPMDKEQPRAETQKQGDGRPAENAVNHKRERRIKDWAETRLGAKVHVDEDRPERPVVGLDFVNTAVTDDDLEHLKYFPKLQWVTLGDDAQVSDLGLAHLKALPHLQLIQPAVNRSSDAGRNVIVIRGASEGARGKVITGPYTLVLCSSKGTSDPYWLVRLEANGFYIHFAEYEIAFVDGCTLPEMIPAHVGVCQGHQQADNTASQEREERIRNCTEAAQDGTVIVDVDPPERPVNGLDLANTQVTNGELAQYLKDSPDLQSVGLSSTKVTEIGLALKGLTQITWLDLGCTQVTDADLEHIRGLAKLQCIRLWNTNVTDFGVKDLGRLENLHYLDMSGTKLTDVGLEHMAGLTNLTTLGLGCTAVTDTGLARLNSFSDLQTLDLTNTQVTDAGLERVGMLTNIRHLGLKCTKVTDAGLACLNSFSNLQTLDLTNTQVTDVGVARLKGLAQLQRLNLCGTKITDVGLVHLKDLTRLQSLDLTYTAITSLEHIKGLTQLHWLSLSGTKISDTQLEDLKNLLKLRMLDLRGTRVSDEGIKAIRQALPKCMIQHITAACPVDNCHEVSTSTQKIPENVRKATSAAGVPGCYVAARDRKPFHHRDCEVVTTIAETQLVRYATAYEAIAAGKNPCRACCNETVQVDAQFRLARQRYAKHTDILAKRYKASGRQLSVVTYRLATSPDGVDFSYARWQEGVDSILPETDVIVFGPKGRTSILVGWQRALNVVGTLMERIDVNPPRYRVSEFPSEEQLAAMGSIFP